MIKMRVEYCGFVVDTEAETERELEKAFRAALINLAGTWLWAIQDQALAKKLIETARDDSLSNEERMAQIEKLRKQTTVLF